MMTDNSKSDDDRAKACPTIGEVAGQALGALLATGLVEVIHELVMWLLR